MFVPCKRWFVCLLMGGILSITILTALDVEAYTHHKSPVHWMEYSAKAFARAKAENRPIFMLITAAWCYNCRIYEEKTLKRKLVAEFINQHYIPVFVDYDRRQDIAATYSSVGIPVTSILAPNGEILVSVPGYIPEDRLRANLQKTLDYLASDYKPSSVKESESGTRPPVYPTPALLEGYGRQFVSQMATGFDLAYGGFGTGRKEPHADVLLRLLELQEQGGKRWAGPLHVTLDAILGPIRKPQKEKTPPFEKLRVLRREQASLLFEVEALQTKDLIAGIYDQIEGGFFRYDTRRNWTVPHFEKMLFENSQLVDMFLAAYSLYKKAVYREAAVNSLAYIQRVLFNRSDGRFYGSQLADEVYYHFTAAERKKVAMPPVDRTSYAVSSSRAIITFLNASETLHNQQYRRTAIQALGFLENNMTGKNGAFSYYDPGKKRGVLNGHLKDNAWMAAAFLRGYEITGYRKYLELTKHLVRFTAKNLYDPVSGGFFARRSTSRDMYRRDKLFDRTKDFTDNGIMAAVLLGLNQQVKDSSLLVMLETTVGYFLKNVEEGGLKADSPQFHRVVQRLIALEKIPKHSR